MQKLELLNKKAEISVELGLDYIQLVEGHQGG